jgi:hypothetical protein
MPRGMCETLSVAEGTKLDPTSLLSLTSDLTSETSAGDIYAFCAVKHEARHTCDASSRRACETEQHAYTESRDCMRGIYASACEVADTPSWCADVKRAIEAHDAAYAFNVCACEEASSCASCRTRCKTQFTELSATCDESATAYCVVNGK